MARHADLTANTAFDVYFADPNIAHQRGSTEKVHGLVRKYLPQGSDLSA